MSQLVHAKQRRTSLFGQSAIDFRPSNDIGTAGENLSFSLYKKRRRKTANSTIQLLMDENNALKIAGGPRRDAISFHRSPSARVDAFPKKKDETKSRASRE